MVVDIVSVHKMNKFLDQSSIDEMVKYALDAILKSMQQKELNEIIENIDI